MPTRTASLSPDLELQVACAVARGNLDVYGHLALGLEPAPHHRLVAAAIQSVVDGTRRDGKRKLLIVLPPGHGKSTIASQLFPAHHLGRHPNEHILFFTSSDTNARIYGGAVKALLEENEVHPLIFPEPGCRPNPDRGWSTDGLYLRGAPQADKDPSYRAVGFGAAVIGARAHGIITDDPLTQEQSLSAGEVAKAQRYYDMTISKRLHPGGWELAIMTRWGDADYASWLMNKPDWAVLHLPAIGAYPWGQALWAERFPLEWLEQERANTGGPVFNCVYMGDPSSLGGPIFRESSWFRPLPDNFTRQGKGVLQYWDLNLSGSDTGDFAACCTAAVDKSANTYVTGMFRDRLEGVRDAAGEWTFGQAHEDAMVEQIRLHQPHWVGVEKMAYKQRAVLDLVQRVQLRVKVPITAVEVSKDKVMRARLPAARAEAGMLFVDRKAPWFPVLEAECRAFPNGPNDDQVDTLSGICSLAVDALALWKDQARAPQMARFG